MAKYKVLIVDDEPRVVKRLADIIGQDPDFEVVHATTNPVEAADYESEHPVDLAIVDIEMGPYNGLDLIRNFAATTHSIVCTAHHDLGDPSLLAGAKHFFTKPFDEHRVHFALGQFKQDFGKEMRHWQEQPGKRELVVPLKGKSGDERISLDEIACFYAEGNKTCLMFLQGGRRTVAFGLRELELLLKPHGFIRTHRAYIANMQYANILYRTKEPMLEFGKAVSFRVSSIYKENQLPVSRSYFPGVASYFTNAAH